ncbi:MAG: hypothetical protein A2054_06800 [Deltaproteobacteria bacterium GWA2_55_10]|nr:MAG: hypothetical protein A2054_06800 [Deltaproteobacteria bacterium GWA2_55_10]
MELEREIMKAILSSQARSIMIVGGADTGKTSLIEALADLLSRDSRMGILDLDMGQSHIGPPTTLGWGVVSKGFKGWERIKTAGLYFTGATSPPGNLLPSLAGARLLLDRALQRCDKVVIDTTGLISEPLGRVYKQYKIDLLSPDIVIGIERTDELGHILDAYRYQRRPKVFRVPVSQLAIQKTIIRRTDWRAQKYREYFEDVKELRIDSSSVGLRFTRDIEEYGLEGRLVSFRDNVQRDLALGYITDTGLVKGRISVRTPLKKGAAYTTVIIGRAKVEF